MTGTDISAIVVALIVLAIVVLVLVHKPAMRKTRVGVFVERERFNGDDPDGYEQGFDEDPPEPVSRHYPPD